MKHLVVVAATTCPGSVAWWAWDIMQPLKAQGVSLNARMLRMSDQPAPIFCGALQHHYGLPEAVEVEGRRDCLHLEFIRQIAAQKADTVVIVVDQKVARAIAQAYPIHNGWPNAPFTPSAEKNGEVYLLSCADRTVKAVAFELQSVE